MFLNVQLKTLVVPQEFALHQMEFFNTFGRRILQVIFAATYFESNGMNIAHYKLFEMPLKLMGI